MNGRGSKKKSCEGGFLQLPWVVMDSPGFQTLKPASIRVLLMVARQYNGKNNGRLLATPKWLARCGCLSHDTIARARRELVEHGLLFQTVQGGRPNRASWYALTWRDLDGDIRYDPGTPAAFAASRRGYQRYAAKAKNKRFIPNLGTKARSIVPTIGHTPGAAIPLIGTMKRSA